MRERQPSEFERTDTDDLSVDDRLLIRAIAIVGDVMREREVAYLLERWPWGRPMTWERVRELEARGLLLRATDGWFVPHAIDAMVTKGLGAAVQRLLFPFVGGVVCREARTMDRFRIGVRRVLMGDDLVRVVECCRAWANTPAGLSGPRGVAFLSAAGLERVSAPVRLRIVAAVPELESSRSMLARVRTAWRAIRTDARASIERAAAGESSH